jgi:hypothetical protein
MQAIFNPRVAAHGFAKGLSLTSKTQEVIAAFLGHLLTNPPFRFDHADTAQARPPLLRIEIGSAVRIRDGPLLPTFQPSMLFACRLLPVIDQVGKSRRERIGEQVDDILIHCPLIGFEGEHIRATLLFDLLGDLGQTAQRIDADNATCQVQLP